MNSLKLKIKIKSLKPHYPRKKKKKKTHVFYNIQQLRLCLVAENLAGQRSFQSPATQLLYIFSATKQSLEMKWERERERERNLRDLRVVGFGRIERSHGSFSLWIRADCCADKLGGMVWGLVVHGWDFANFHKALLYIETTTLEWTFQILYFYQKSLSVWDDNFANLFY